MEVAREDPVFLLAEILFLITSGGTIAYYLKMLRMTFFGADGVASEKAARAPLAMLLPMGVLAALITAIGLLPNLALERLVYPVLKGYTFDHHAAGHILTTRFFTVHGFEEVLLVTVIGVSIFTVGWRKDLLFIEIPRPLGPDYWYERIGTFLVWLAKGPFQTLDGAINRGYVKTGQGFLRATKAAMELDERIDHGYVETGHKFLEATLSAMELDERIDRTYVGAGERLIEGAGPGSETPLQGERRFRYLREPVTIFDQSTEELFREVALDVADAIKYPYAFTALLFDRIMGRAESKDLKARADEFEAMTRKFLAETPNISGISIAVFIIVGMLAIYLFTAILG
ncbi:MAG: hypothetical protein D6733_07205 [Methanobacteriota archaeon]|nr:MAG: hypothetical protein D6733_07205 [Euryarchaeota archaeon]